VELTKLQPLLSPSVVAMAGLLAPVLAFFSGLGLGLSARPSAALAGFCGAVIVCAPAYARLAEPAVHGTDLNRRGNPRVDRLYRSRSRDPIYILTTPAARDLKRVV
jgi:hypothetical protein